MIDPILQLRAMPRDQLDAWLASLPSDQFAEVEAIILAETQSARQTPLMDFIADANPGYSKPLHLKPFIDLLERVPHERIRAVVSTPPQHSKTTCTQSALIRYLQTDAKRHAYVTYSQEKAEEVSRSTQWIADRVGLSYTGNLNYWLTDRRGSIKFTGIGGALTGHAVDGVLIVDDPIKGREDAESLTMRDNNDNWMKSVALTRLHPAASCILIQTRWHSDDLAGRMIARGWDTINLKAIQDDGTALWEEQRPLSFLQQQQNDLGPYDWNALYMGSPRSREGNLFKRTPERYATLPQNYSLAIGVDFAYSGKTHADASAFVVLAEHDAKWYVVEARRAQIQAPEFAAELKKLQGRPRYRTVPMMWDASTTERGQADIMRSFGVPVQSRLAIGDPFLRAQKVAAAWNRGDVLVPQEGSEWLDVFMHEIDNFTGIKDPHDDQVAALASAFSMLPARAIKKDPQPGTPEYATDFEQRMFREALGRAREQRSGMFQDGQQFGGGGRMYQ